MPVEGAILWLSTVTCALSLFWGRGQDLGIVATNDGSHVVHTAVAALDIVPVEQLMVPLMFREMLVHKREELACYVSRDVLVEWGLNQVTLRLRISLITLLINVLHITVETAFPEGPLVDGVCPVELLSIARYRCESTADCSRQVPLH